MSERGSRTSLLKVLGACLVLSASCAVRAEVVPIAGPPRTGPITITPGEGVTSGGNLFFQFRVFNIFAAAGESVTFTPPASGAINNVITHVRGDPGLFFPGVRASVIDGPLVSQMAGANFFLINPQGIIFGPSAQVHVGGSFFASSADNLQFTEVDGSVVSFPDQVSMTAAEPSAFGFLGPNPKAVSVQGAQLRPGVGAVPPTLSLGAGGAFTLVGGDVSVSDSAPYRAAFPIGAPLQTALVDAPTGSINLVSAAGAGSVPVNLSGAATVTAFGPITVRDSAVIDAHDVYIRGGRLVVQDSIIAPGSAARLGVPAPAPNGGGVRVQVSGDVSLDGRAKLFGGFGDLVPGITTFNTSAGGDVPAISIEAGSLTVRNVSAIRSQRAGAGAAPGISVNAGSVTLSGGGLISGTNARTGAGPDVTVRGGSVLLDTGAQITTANAATGGDVPGISVTADSLVVRNASAIRTTRSGSGAAPGVRLDVGALEVSGGGLIESTNTRPGAGANVMVNANTVTISGGGISGSNRLTAGANGDVPAITVTADGSLNVTNGGFIASLRQGTGAAGAIMVDAGAVEVSNGGVIGSVNFFQGPGANVTVGADSVLLQGDGGVSVTGLLAQARSVSPVGNLQPDSGNIVLSAGSLEIRNGAEITSDSFGLGRGGSIDIDVEGSVLLARDGAERGGIFAQSAIAGDAGSVTLDAGTLEMRDGFPISAITGGFGDAGNVAVNVAGDVTMSGDNTGIFSRAQDVRQEDLDTLAQEMRVDLVGLPRFASFDDLLSGFGLASLDQFLTVLGVNTDPGVGGNIDLAANNLIMNADTRIDASTVTDGAAGDLNLRLRGSLTLSGGAQIRGRSGLTSGGVVTAGSGAGGALDLQVADSIVVTGVSPTRVTTPSAITSTALGDGNGGNLSLQSRELRIDSGGTVSASTEGAGRAGNIVITTTEQVLLNNGSITTTALGDGDGGSLTLSGRGLRVEGGGAVSASSEGAGSAGNIAITAADQVLVSGGSVTTTALGDGDGGELTLSSRGLRVEGGGTVSASSEGAGLAGNITILTSDQVVINNGSVTTSALGDGDGGNVALQTRELRIEGGGSISASSEGTGLAGNINIQAADQILMNNGSITTAAKVSDGGNITIMTRLLLDMINSEITTSVESGEGGGGNIFIDPAFVVLQNSRIIANAFGGPGGNIRIVAGQFIMSPDSVVEASSQQSVDGNVDIDAPDSDVSASLAPLPDAFLDATSLLKGQCDAARGVGGGNSLVVSGRGGVPPEPDGYVPSLAVTSRGAGRAAGMAAGASFEVSVEGSGRVMLARVGLGCA